MSQSTPSVVAVPASGSSSTLRRAASVVLTLIVLGSLIPLAIEGLGSLVGGDVAGLLFTLLFLVLPASLGLVGAALSVRRPENLVGWLLLASGALAGLAFAGGEYARINVATRPADPIVVLGAWVGSWVFIPAVGMLVAFLPLLYPTGRLLSPRWRAVAFVGALGIATGTLGSALAPGPMGDPGGPVNPVGVGEPLLSVLGILSVVSNLLAPPVFLLALASLVVRFRRASEVERQQLKWLLFVASIATVAFAISIIGITTVSDVAWVVGLVTIALLPLAIGLAILRYGLYEIDRIVNRTIVYGAVTAILAGVFAAATALSQRLFISIAGQSSDASVVLTTLVVVAGYAPIRKRVEAVVDRYFKYDQREYGPYLDELRRLLDLIEPRRAAGRLAREAMRHTGAIGVAVTDGTGSMVATAGRWPVEPVVTVQVPAGGSAFGAVLIGPRRHGKPLPPARVQALAEAAAVAVRALQPDSPRS